MSARHRSPGGVCRECVCTHAASSHLLREKQRCLIQKLILARLVAQNLAHARVLLRGCFKQLQDVVPLPVPGRRRMLFVGKKRNARKAERTDYLIFSAFVLYFVPSIKFLKRLISLRH